MNAFGVIVSGLAPVFTPSTITDALHCVYRVPECTENPYIIVFLTGAVPFPATHVARLFLAFAPSNQNTNQSTVSWVPLGTISTSKPSAMYKVSNTDKDTQDLLIGISVEAAGNPFAAPAPGGSTTGTAPTPSAAPASSVNKRAVAMKIAGDFVGFAERYVAEHPNALQASREFIPTTVVQSWIDRTSTMSNTQ